MAQHAGVVGLEHGVDLFAGQHAAQRQIARRGALGEAHEVGGHLVALGSPPMTEPAETADHLVEDEQSAVLIAQRPQTLQVTGLGRVDAGGALERLSDHCGDAPLVGGKEFLHLGQVVGLGVHDVGQQLAPPFAVGGQPLGGGAAVANPVVGPLTSDDHPSFGLILPRPVQPAELERGLHRPGARIGEKHPGVRHRRAFRQRRAEPLGGVVREHLEGVKRLQRTHLRGDRLCDLESTVAHLAIPQRGHGIDVAVAVVVPHRGALTAHDVDELVGGWTSERVKKRGLGHLTPLGSLLSAPSVARQSVPGRRSASWSPSVSIRPEG